jgi:hypothetical protein
MDANIIISVRPSLAYPGRWSVDSWTTDRPRAAFQADRKHQVTVGHYYLSLYFIGNDLGYYLLL